MNEETLFQEALSRSPEERAAFLDRACAGRPELRASVESLLAAHEKSGHILDRPQVDPNATVEKISDPVGASASASATKTADFLSQSQAGVVIGGRYTLLEEIGEGGMGVVSVAKQTEPVKRKVALKLIKTGMDSRGVLARFEQERQALAMMDHPNIARVLDGGLTPTGQPFFVMELVNGLPLTKFCDEVRLTPRERLELFVPICQAVQHAHQKGIVHRDLKPANILITLIDGKAVPKVIDFGVAKATAGKLTDESMSTQFGAVVGTLEYMSPEQAGFSGTDVDTRADIYSLGVILYELLTGLRPIDAKRLKKAALTEMIRIIQEEEPSKPSTRLSTDESLASMAALRHTDPRKLMALLRGELDWVVMKCLEKQRERRYDTANALARDIQRYLADDAVEARPVSAGYRFRKFLKRNKGPVLAASFVILALLLGLIGTAWGLYRADLALQAEAAQRKIAVEERKKAEEQRTRAETREQQAIDAVKKFRDAVANNPELKNNPSLESLRKKLLKEPLAFFKALRERLQADHDTRPESLARLAQASHNLGHLTSEIGDLQDAIVAYRESLVILEKLANANPSDTQIQSELAKSHNNIGTLLSETGHPVEALKAYEAALAIQQKLADANPTDISPNAMEIQQGIAVSYNNIGLLLASTGRSVEALKAHEAARAIWQKWADGVPFVPELQIGLAISHQNIGALLRETGHPVEAIKACETARAIQQKLADANPSDTQIQSELALSHDKIGVLLNDTGHPAEALKAYETARAIQQKLVEDNPSVSRFQRELAATHNNIGILLINTGHPAEALKAYETARAIQQKLVEDNPSVSRFQRELADTYNNIGVLLSNTGHPAEALKSYEAARAIQQKLADANSSGTQIQSGLANSCHNIGALLSDSGQTTEALKAYETARAIQQKLVESNPFVTEFQTDLASSHNSIGLLLSEIGHTAEALKSYEAARAIQQKLVEANPSVTEFQSKLAASHNNLGTLLRETGHPAEAMKAGEAALAILRKLARDHPESPDFASHLGASLNNLATIDFREKRFVAARDRLREAVEWQRKALAANPANSTYRQFLANHWTNLIDAYQVLGDAAGVAEAVRELATVRDSSPALVALDARLAAILNGEQQPRDNSERLQLAQRAYDKALHASAAKLWGEALAADPKVAEDRQASSRYNAACAGALAGCGRGKDVLAPDEMAKARLREQARVWLQAELAVWTKLVESGPTEARPSIAQTLAHWKEDTDLVGVRDDKELDNLPEAQRKPWQSLWSEVDALLVKAKGDETHRERR